MRALFRLTHNRLTCSCSTFFTTTLADSSTHQATKMHAFLPIVALLGLAAAQSETSGSATGTSSAADSNPTTACLADCAVGDVNCQALCVNVPAPNEDQINATQECSRNECTQGDSGPEDTKKYGECLASCAADFYYTSGGTVTGVATAASSATGSSTPNNGTDASTTGTGSSSSATGSGASETGSSSDSSETESSASSTASDSAGMCPLVQRSSCPY